MDDASPRGDATEMPLGGVAVPKPAINTVHRPVRYRFGVASPRGDGAEMPVGMMAVAKDRWMTVSPREDATELLVGRVPVPKTR